MSHEITVRANNQAEMAYVGQEPWHGLGQKLEAGASIETWRKAAGMDWSIKRSVVRFATERDGDQGIRTIDDKHVLFRSDNKQHLSIVSEQYKVVQPKEVLEFFRDLTDKNGFTLDTAGTLFDGRQFWALASVGEEAVIVGDDKIKGYLLLSTSCDTTLATTARFTTVRVVCNNTLSMAVRGRAREARVTHRKQFNADAVKDQLGIARDNFGDFLAAARKLSNVVVPYSKAEQFVEALLDDSGIIKSTEVTESKQYKKILDLFSGQGIGSTMQGSQGTAWGLVNAVTEFVDHHARARSASQKLANAWYGYGDALKTEAFQRLVETA